MKAAVYEQYGAPEVVSIREVPTPTPAAGEVLIRVHATTVSTGDWRARSLEMPPGFGPFGRLFFGISRPRQPILGTELSGTIAALGAGVSNFAVGDEVFAFADAKMGAHAEFRCIAADGLVVKKPARLTFEQAAAISFGGMTMIGFYDRAAPTRRARARERRVGCGGVRRRPARASRGCRGDGGVQCGQRRYRPCARRDSRDRLRARGLCDHWADVRRHRRYRRQRPLCTRGKCARRGRPPARGPQWFR